MMKYFKINNINIFLIVFFCFILFFPGFTTYFYQDDFIHLSYSQSFRQIVESFNILNKASYPYYRPISTQLYFYIGKLIFGFNPLGYHIINFILFILNIILVNRLVKLLTNNHVISLLSCVFFAINSTHIAPLFSAANVQELFFVLFGLLTVDNYIRWLKFNKIINYHFSILFLVFALMSKETAIILPGILFITNIYTRKINLRKLFKDFIPYLLISFIYLIGHYFYGYPTSPSYKMIIGVKNINILFWYLLWSLSTPNILIDFVGPGLKLNHVFLEVAKTNGWTYFIFFPLFVISFIFVLISVLLIQIRKNIFTDTKLIVFGILWFIIGLLPLIVFPLHRLATEQSFSLIGLSLILGLIIYKGINNKILLKAISVLSLIVYLIVATNSIYLARRTHWVINSAEKAKNVVVFFKNNYSDIPKDTIVYFKNGIVKIPEYGSSRQIYLALGNGIGLKLILNRQDLSFFYEDVNPLPENLKESANVLTLDASTFLGY
ncbi:hypothetical protein COV53_04505 [Candidatus Gottesmanbacteria bacterium CG11_big_fil_rev_8_21_14_0_20_37_11]|uniref:Uncharacterized protein n=2 Tax=Candidatus Gottesmaniibacteriota TaxID=1752720 RepID=A0A2M7RPE0_9BACT|nr:MAG: hypothetical protein COX23_00940 [Candidatus Gottesmanbacteria bacterium CG23_combo_of_CG06-09_8_20_14_all_37_19]PIR08142.1 MAG: hypothetical protein COV53_04505 [Candidatus Gottesmanbacteria bacterium CG11_big_fil_rev_8_21_14_0_20_37_11]PIZ02173.1 MAG: hypothetical protein COY59_06125 [Candidatus Gottesmanbacteria bacterium CG_4_10_14_0_8_um_filter_37_24]